MQEPDLIDLWNVHHGTALYVGAQRIVNVVGRLTEPGNIRRLTYSLNGSPPRPVVFKVDNAADQRLAHEGDFCIDTIDRRALREQNTLVLSADLRDGQAVERTVEFRRRDASEPTSAPFRLDLTGVRYVAEVGQVVDGHWRIGQDSEGKPCLEIIPADAGLDRIILFGRE